MSVKRTIEYMGVKTVDSQGKQRNLSDILKDLSVLWRKAGD